MKKTLLVLSLAVLMFLPVLAVVNAQPLTSVTVPIGGGSAVTLNEVETLIRRIANFLITISLIIAVVFIIWGGITYMAAGSNEEAAGKAKTRIWNGIIGALIVLAVGVILNTLAGLIARTFFS